MKYNEVLLDEIIRLKQEKDLTWEAIADYVNDRYTVRTTGNALRKATASHQRLQDRLDEGKDSDFFVPFVKDYDDFIKLPYQNSIVISDVHLPFYNYKMANKMIRVARKFGITRLNIIGDLFDAKAYSRFPTAYDVSQDDAEYEIDAIREFLITCAGQFNDIYICTGNHEFRIMNKLERKFRFKTLLRTAVTEAELGGTMVHVTDYPRMYTDGILRSGTWMGHPKSYSIVKTNVPRDLCTKYQANIITGHSHHLVMTSHISGQFYIAESGCLADPKKQEYLAMNFAKNPEWHPGFLMIRNEIPYLFDERLLTDWAYWLDTESDDE